MIVLTEQRSLLWFGPGQMPANVEAALSGQWQAVHCPTAQAVSDRLNGTGLVLIAPAADEKVDTRRLSSLLDEIDRSQAVAIVLIPEHSPEADIFSRRRGQYVLVDVDAPPVALAACLEAAAALQPTIRDLQTDVAAVRGFGAGTPLELERVDEEMRLAARLQRDFLPRSLPQVSPVRFAALFRPASWVSGDIYDVFRLDEDNIGFYVADVVGHGMPAALLSIFVKRALQTKRIVGSTYEIVSPDEALTQLNEDICQQELTSCQFCTAVYGIVNVRSLLLRYARGGHPVPLLLSADGSLDKLDAAGPLLGVLPGESFELGEISLCRGDRLVVYSDGLEEAMCPLGGAGGLAMGKHFAQLRELQPEEMIFQLAGRIDTDRATDRPADDITVLVMDIANEQTPPLPPPRSQG